MELAVVHLRFKAAKQGVIQFYFKDALAFTKIFGGFGFLIRCGYRDI